jgi:DNA-nicking Smr family endonuclease
VAEPFSSDTEPEEDSALFRASIGRVRPIRGKRRSEESLRRAPPQGAEIPRREAFVQALAESAQTLTETGEELLYLKPGVAPALLWRLRRGRYAVRDEIDLHAMDARTAEEVLKRFLEEARREERLCVKIIHGKGLRSRGRGPVLKALVDRMLRLRADVLAFAPARPQQGGTGATIVLLAARRPRRGGNFTPARPA